MAGIHERNARRDAALTYLAVAALVTVLMTWVHVDIPLVGSLGPSLVALLFVFVPMEVGRWRGEVIEDYGFVAAPVGAGLRTAGVAMAIAFPIFIAAYFGFYEVACRSTTLQPLVPPGLCTRYVGLAALHAPHLDADLGVFAALQLVVVAMPEELFFRGFLLGLLEKRFPPRRRWRGGGIGIALFASSLGFALIHLPRTGDPRQLMTFFPGLLFGWMASARRSLLPSTVTHASCNVLIHLLDQVAQRW